MKGAAKRKVVTSGRLTGRVKAEMARKRAAPPPAAAGAAAACPEPAYSLYSTDSEDQVTTLHKGLDRCAALLGGILQDEKADSPSFSKAVADEVVKSRPTTSIGKKMKQPTKTVQRNFQSGHCGSSSTTPRSSHRSTAAAAHSGVKLHPPWKGTRAQLQSHPPRSQTNSPSNPPPQCQIFTLTPQPPSPPIQPQPSILLSVVQSSSHSGQLSLHPGDAKKHCDEEEDEFVPVRDTETQIPATDTHKLKSANMQLEPGQGDGVPQDTDHRSNCMKVKTVQYLLKELKALIAGQGSVAEMLLSHLEQTVTSPQMNEAGIETGPDLLSVHSQNSQLRRCVKILKEQLEEKEKAESRANTETLCNAEVLALQEELNAAQSRLQDLQDDLAELRTALQDTQRHLRDRELESVAVKTELEATRSRLVKSEKEKSELAALAQRRLEEIENLNRILEHQASSDCPTVVLSVSDAELKTPENRKHQAEPPCDHITHYLKSLDKLDPTEHECVAEEKEGRAINAAEQNDLPSGSETSNSQLIQSRGLDEVQSCKRWLERERQQPLNSTLSQWDLESLQTDWSMTSGSTFNTRDEAAFRDGLAALDASIASLQKTIQLDLRR
ncbi:hypothetical protein Q5P01_005440 [Channa striata]|uniref:Coiled-coil domain-containing protein 14 n=1 Tax=Channa striata TaxID=64152 RepID=A0AA88T1B0_CHASR|nr:hypothetical protein Q5P01_005440 [Channa striata]